MRERERRIVKGKREGKEIAKTKTKTRREKEIEENYFHHLISSFIPCFKFMKSSKVTNSSRSSPSGTEGKVSKVSVL